MLTPRVSLRLLSPQELIDDPHPEACVEFALGAVCPSGNPGAVVVPEPVRVTPADLVRLRIELDLALGEIRAEVLRAEAVWEQQRGRWYEEGRQAVEAGTPDVALLQRVLDGLRRPDMVPA